MIFANAFLRWVVDSSPSDDRQPEFHWMNLPESWQVFVLVGIVFLLGLFVFWTYVRELKTCPLGLKLTLAFLRFTVLFLLVLVFLKPSITFRRDIVRKPNIVLAIDRSASMAFSDEYRDPAVVKRLHEEYGFSEEDLKNGKVTRFAILKKALERNDLEFLRKLRNKGSVRITEFDTESRTVKTLSAITRQKNAGAAGAGSSGAWAEIRAEFDKAYRLIHSGAGDSDQRFELDSDPTGKGTDIWQALNESIDAAQVAAIVLVSDGQNTTENDPVLLARKAAEKNVPIFAIGIGDPYKSRNIWVDKLRAPLHAVNPGEPFDVKARISFQRIDVSNINVQLVRQEVIGENLGPEEEPISKVVTLPAKKPDEGEDSQGSVEVQFKPVLQKAGKFQYKLKITTEIPDEENLDDNVKVADSYVEVTDEKSRVLLISGAPTWEYQLVRKLLQRDPNYEVSCWLQTMDIERQQEGNIPIERLPETFAEFSEYNAIILIDPDPQKDLDQNFFDMLKKFVEEKAGGVMFMAGPKYTAMTLSLSKSKSLQDILPVEFPDPSTTLLGFDSSASTSTKMEINIPNIGHQVMRFFQDPNENLTQWQAMPGIYWSYPAARAKPITRVLIEHGDITQAIDAEHKRPLLVAGRFGLGNSLYMGFTGTWRWRRVGRQAHFFDAFWINVVKFLVSNRSLQASRRGIVATDRPDFEIGERVDFHATVFDPAMKKMKVDSLDGELMLNGERIEALKFKLVTPGEYKASWIANTKGTLAVKLDVGGAVLETTIKVDEPQDEQKARSLNLTLLREIAKDSGGEYFAVDNLGQLVEVIPDQERTIPQLTTPEPIWGMPEVRREFLLLCFLLPFVFLTAEWALRKAFKLL